MIKPLFSIFFVLLTFAALAQGTDYAQKKKDKLSRKSPFEEIIEKNDPNIILYQDEEVFVIEPLSKSFPVHLLIIPKKRINTLNDASPADQAVLGKMFLVAKEMAARYGIAESGYRVAMNTNEHAGQSVFHIHLHLYGGANVGPMIDPEKYKPAPTKSALLQQKVE
ncbi:HIT domain-containing protein [Cesiribacter sp. SM1]|uniref:HIT domain-containing protein n=1 Tax=Cesiribacter sp. SM1 TaxID=2861196 RepID=UPI001CD1E357|nr:HIT domain-containing protein [Cesiribacter sp. SM1]